MDMLYISNLYKRFSDKKVLNGLIYLYQSIAYSDL